MRTRDRLRLWQDVTERSEYHVIDPFWRYSNSFCEARAGPRVASEIRVLCAELEPASWTVVKAVPEAYSSLDQRAGIRRAIAQTCGSEAGVQDRKSTRLNS